MTLFIRRRTDNSFQYIHYSQWK